MKKSKPKKARPPTLAKRLADAENQLQEQVDVSELLRQQAVYNGSEKDRIAKENTCLSKIIDGLKEELFNKSLALAHAEGKLERVDHEDAERAEVIMVHDLQLTRIDHHSGAEVSGGPVPFKRTMLKYELAQPKHMVSASNSYLDDGGRDQYGRPTTNSSKHWVNRH